MCVCVCVCVCVYVCTYVCMCVCLREVFVRVSRLVPYNIRICRRSNDCGGVVDDGGGGFYTMRFFFCFQTILLAAGFRTEAAVLYAEFEWPSYDYYDNRTMKKILDGVHKARQLTTGNPR
ncbi:Hypothetical protein CINCED_3A022206 [Cinara cedri]|uniref:Uncharacterized protein n=1 Tax=Cinara cedri TaxID=506608 RepID=A0A5E4MZ12_9HEMI|nr:Hypothetical protein CINCED_3A022206 [Cinara cedri]